MWLTFSIKNRATGTAHKVRHYNKLACFLYIVVVRYLEMAKRKALLYTYSEDNNYEIEIEESTDLTADGFDWEKELLEPLNDKGENPIIDNGVSWGWA